jgi:hypothetical protein
MIKFTIVSGKLVLDPNIVLFDELHDLYKCKNGEKYLQVIHFRHSKDTDNPFKDLDKRVIDQNIYQTVFKKDTWDELKTPKSTEAKFIVAEALFVKYNNTAESRLLESMDMKFDQISTLLNDTTPSIEESVLASGKVEFTSNLTIILNLFTKIETIMKSKTLLTNAIMKQEGAGRIRGGGTSSFREKGLLRKK